MDVFLPPVCEDKEPLNVSQVIGIIKGITNFGFRPKQDQFKQIEYISKLEKLVTQDEDGDYVVEKIFHEDYGCAQALIKLISTCFYPHVVLRALTLIHKCMSQTRNSKGTLLRRISSAHIFENGQVLINILMNIEDQFEFVGKSPKVLCTTYYYLLSILNIGCKRDKNFCMFFDRHHVIKKLLNLLAKYNKSIKTSVVVLDIFKFIMKSHYAMEFTANRYFFENLEGIFNTLKSKKSPKIRSVVILVKLLIKHDHINESIFETRIIHFLLSLLVNDDNLPLSYNTYRSIILSVNKLVKRESFLQYFRSNANIRLLYRFCAHFPVTEDKHFITVLKACSIIHACLIKRELFIDNIKCYVHPLAENNRKNDNKYYKTLLGDEEYLSNLSEDSEAEDEDEEDDIEDDDEEGIEVGDKVKKQRLNSDEHDYDHERSCQDCINIVQSYELPHKKSLFSTLGLCTSFDDYTFDQKLLTNLSSDSDEKIKIFEDIVPNTKRNDVYCILASRVCTKRQLIKVAYPDFIGAESLPVAHYLTTNHANFSRSKLLQILDRVISEKAYSVYPVVFDLDNLQRNETARNNDVLKCDDVNSLGNNSSTSSLKFESRFEGGNLRKAYKISQHVYNLILAPDVNTNNRYQWFYFEVSNMKAQVSYVFNIINCDKSNTQYNHGMQPVLFSVKDSTLGKIGWVRTGTDIFYYRNNYTDPAQLSAVYHTLSFTVRFNHSNDICYIAYHIPYTYSRLMTYLYGLHTNSPNNIYCSVDTLCYTLAKNAVPLVTITAPKSNSNPIHRRKIVVLTSRVHPAESNSSWAMEGTLRYLLQDDLAVRQLREDFVFKIVPMQNPEGVIYGSYRCGLTTEDLNRCWRNPDINRHPEVFHVKAMVQKLLQLYKLQVSLYLDYHGHSRKKNFFLYGCSNKASWKKSDRRLPDNIEEYMHYPTALAESTKALSLKSCKFNVEKNRESTARITMWREYNIKCSYTVECTYCGFDVGPYKSQSINSKHLLEIGASLMRGLWLITSEAKRCKLSLPYLCLNYTDVATHKVKLSDENNDVTNNNEVLRNVVG